MTSYHVLVMSITPELIIHELETFKKISKISSRGMFPVVMTKVKIDLEVMEYVPLHRFLEDDRKVIDKNGISIINKNSIDLSGYRELELFIYMVMKNEPMVSFRAIRHTNPPSAHRSGLFGGGDLEILK